MSSQGPVGKQTVIQGDASNWTQLLKRQKTYTGLLGTTYNGPAGNTSGVRADLIQSNQLQTDYRIGVSACGVSSSPYPRLRTGQGC
jgi:hypothetical protein